MKQKINQSNIRLKVINWPVGKKSYLSEDNNLLIEDQDDGFHGADPIRIKIVVDGTALEQVSNF